MVLYGLWYFASLAFIAQKFRVESVEILLDQDYLLPELFD